MSLAEEIGPRLDGLEQLRALMASGRKPGILVSLNFDFVEVESGKAVFAGIPGEHAYNPLVRCTAATPLHCWILRAAAQCIRGSRRPRLTRRSN